MKENKIPEILERLTAIRGVKGVILFERSGKVTYKSIPDNLDLETLIAVIKNIIRASQRGSEDLKQGSFSNALLEFSDGKIIFSEVTDNIICIITTKNAKLNIIKRDSENE